MPYKAILSGSHNGYRFTAGKLIPRAPKGALSGCKSAIWIEDEEFEETTKTIIPDSQKPLNGTAKEIKGWLDKNGIEYPSTARKDDLIEILNES